MVVGKTYSSISKTEIFSKFSEVQVLTTVFPNITELPCLISSPLREDNNPSFSIFINENNHIIYKDHANGDKGGLLDLLSKYWRCNFNHTLNKICKLMITDNNVVIKPKQPKIITHKTPNLSSKVQVTIRPWKDYDYEYWASYGITKKYLKYAEIYPISYKIITKKDIPSNKNKQYIFPADKYAYCYVERKEGKVQLKIYQPFNTKGFKWCSKMDSSIIGLWTKIPEYGDRVVICSSLKDALVLTCQLQIPTLCLQGEGYSISETAIKELKRRYKKIYISFDTDEAGISDGKRLAEHTGFINVIPNLGNQKDYSDYYKALKDKAQFKQLKSLFN